MASAPDAARFVALRYNGSCMDRALSVAAAFRSNHPTCRSCGEAPARPALPLPGARPSGARANSGLGAAESPGSEHGGASRGGEGASSIDLAWADSDDRRERFAKVYTRCRAEGVGGGSFRKG